MARDVITNQEQQPIRIVLVQRQQTSYHFQCTMHLSNISWREMKAATAMKSVIYSSLWKYTNMCYWEIPLNYWSTTMSHDYQGESTRELGL